jgi:hypothetical protein
VPLAFPLDAAVEIAKVALEVPQVGQHGPKQVSRVIRPG